jgi:hypothetical protein
MAAFSVRRILYYFSNCEIGNEDNSPVEPNSWLRNLVDTTVLRIQEEYGRGGLSGVHRFLVMDERDLDSYEEENTDEEEEEDEQTSVENLVFTNRINMNNEMELELEEIS